MEKKYKKKCPEGVSREVYQLQKDNESEFGMNFAHSIESKPSIAFIKKTKKSFETKAEKWVYRGFTNAARNDSLELYHWDKEIKDPKREYYFTKFNAKIEIPKYSEEEYKENIADSSWTKEETDALMNLCEEFSLRFIVIYDRFSSIYPGRTIEDLRDRYYTIARKLLEKSAASADSQVDLSKHHMFKYKYNPEHERKRKEQALLLFNRSGGEIEEEKKLMTEYKRIEGFLRKQKQDRIRFVNIQKQYEDAASDESPKKKRRKISSTKESSEDVGIHPTGRGGRRDRGSGAYVRSSRMQTPLTISSATMKKVDGALDAFGIPARPIPTAFISKEYNELRQDIVSLLELQTLVKKKLIELEFYDHQQYIPGEDQSTTTK